MFQPSSHQLTPHTKTFTSQEPSISKPLNWSNQCATPGAEMQNGGLVKVDSIADLKQKHEDELQKLGMRVKHHEDNLRFLKTQLDNLDESILDMQVNLGRYYSSSVSTPQNENNNNLQTEENAIDQILQQENSAAGVLCQLKIRHGTYASHLPFTKDVLGIVATLGKVENDNLSRLLSEVLGLETMMAIVCKTYEGVRALEVYDEEGSITKNLGLHGLAPSIGRHMDGRFLAICLEDLRPYVGELIPNDPQRKLDLLKPRLPNGESPAGFLGFAVNMIILENTNVSCLTASGHGLRETLFYNLFSRMQVYRTRGEMLQALPFISDGALSLDGAIIKSSGIFNLGNSSNVFSTIYDHFVSAVELKLSLSFILSDELHFFRSLPWPLDHLKAVKLVKLPSQQDIGKVAHLLDTMVDENITSKLSVVLFCPPNVSYNEKQFFDAHPDSPISGLLVSRCLRNQDTSGPVIKQLLQLDFSDTW